MFPVSRMAKVPSSFWEYIRFAAEVRVRLEEAGMSAIGNTPEQFAALIKRGFEVYGRAVKLAGVEPE